MRIRNPFFFACLAALTIWSNWDMPHRFWRVGLILTFFVTACAIDRFRRRTR
jgi:hypothetical protein